MTPLMEAYSVQHVGVTATFTARSPMYPHMVEDWYSAVLAVTLLQIPPPQTSWTTVAAVSLGRGALARRGSGPSSHQIRRRRCWHLLRSLGGSYKGRILRMRLRGFVEELGSVGKSSKSGCIITRTLPLHLLRPQAMPHLSLSRERERVNNFLFLFLSNWHLIVIYPCFLTKENMQLYYIYLLSFS